MCHLVGISHQYKIVFMSSTTLCRAVSRARTWFTAVYRWVILPSGISSDCRCPLDMAHRKLCVKWKMNILVTFCINFATRSASRYSLFQVWNVRKICQQSQRTRACRTSRHKLAHCEELATFGNSELCGINHCMCPYATNTAVKRDYENCCPHGLLFINKALKCGEVRMLMTPFLESRALSKFTHESTGQRS